MQQGSRIRNSPVLRATGSLIVSNLVVTRACPFRAPPYLLIKNKVQFTGRFTDTTR
jgi:hypothetical protein